MNTDEYIESDDGYIVNIPDIPDLQIQKNLLVEGRR